MPQQELKKRQVSKQQNKIAVDPSPLQEYLSLAKSIALFLAIAFLLRASVVEAFKIPSSSMEPTLQVGDHILVSKLSYGVRLPFLAKSLWVYDSPKRGDVVVFTRPDDPDTPYYDESDMNIIKRVVGLPGETIKVRGTTVWINGEIYKDIAAEWRQGGRKSFGPATVPPRTVLLLGDNRDASKDSRYWKNPFLDISRIKGRAFIIYWSFFSLKRMFDVIR